MTLFVVLNSSVDLLENLKEKIKAIKTSVSASFVPCEIVKVDEVPRTLSGKKFENY